MLVQTFLAACPAEKEVIDAIRKQNDEVNKQQEKVKNLIDRIAAEIERSSCFEGPADSVKSCLPIMNVVLP